MLGKMRAGQYTTSTFVLLLRCSYQGDGTCSTKNFILNFKPAYRQAGKKSTTVPGRRNANIRTSPSPNVTVSLKDDSINGTDDIFIHRTQDI
jgi:hypothetical protein